MIYFKYSMYVFVFLFGFSSCVHDHAHDTTGGHGHGHGGGIVDTGPPHLTKKQMETVGLEFGDFAALKVNNFIAATGTLDLPPNAYASVSAKSAGFIGGSKKYVEGSYIKQGTVMGYVENPSFIDMQREYLEIQAAQAYTQLEYKRQKTLVDENAGILKKVEQLQSELTIQNVKLKGLEKHLRYLGIDVGQLTTENIRQRISIIAPISGYLTSIDMHNGLYVEPQRELMEVVDESHLHLELDVFEKDIANLVEDQKISYSVPALGSQVYTGEVHVIGKEFNRENKTVRVHGHLDKERPKFIRDLFISAKLWLDDATVPALPEDAVLFSDGVHFIYVAKQNDEADEIVFTKIMVKSGAEKDGFVAVNVIDEIPDGMDIVTKGAYYVYAQSKIGEVAHEH